MSEIHDGMILGIDPGIRGGAGLAFVRDLDGALMHTEQVGRDPGLSTIQMMRAVRDAVLRNLHSSNTIAIAREDHVFPQQIERIARNILRRMNGVIDVAITDMGYVEGETYFGFPVGTWKVLSGLPGDLGKEVKATQKGEAMRLGGRRKKGTATQYLAAINALLGHDHKTVDEADAHAIAKAARIVRHVRDGRMRLYDLPERVAESVWDKEKTGLTLFRALKDHREVFGGDPLAFRKYFRDFAL